MMTFVSNVEGAESLDAIGAEPGLFDPLFQD
jgi:hypothetical protein